MSPRDRAEIEYECTRLSYAFAYHIDHREYRELAALFTPDGVFERHGTRLEGRDAIASALEGRPQDQFTRHVTTNFHFTDVAPTIATAALVNLSWFSFNAAKLPIAFEPSNAILLDFDDRYALTDEGWRIAARVTRMLFVAPGLLDH